MGFDQCVEQTLWNTVRDTELRRPLTQTEEIRRKTGIPHEQIAHDRLWNKRPDGIAFKMPTKTKARVICLLGFKRMSDVTSHCIVRAKHLVETQYASLRSALAITMQRQGWKVEQVGFIAGARSLNEEELKKNLTYFEGPPVSIEPIHTKLIMKIFDEYANILKGMYSIRFTEDQTTGILRSVQITEDPTTGTLQPVQLGDPRLLVSTLSQPDRLTKLGNTRRERKRERNN